jgi:hypothetical protein
MGSKLAVAILLVSAGSAAATTSPLSSSDLVGTWRCGPTFMQGPGFTVTVTDETTKLSDGTFIGHSRSLISAPGKPPLTLEDRSSGTWELVGDVVRSRINRIEFLSASDPSITKDAGQRAQDEQLAKKSVYESRILEFNGTHSRSIPVNSMYEEAAVESTCERI